MFDAIAHFFSNATAVPMADNDPRLAVAVLLVHLAAVDGTVGEEEKIAVRAALMDYYGLEEEAVRRLVHEARRKLGDRITYAETGYAALDGADALVVVTDWNEYRHPDFARIRQALRHPIVVDGRNLYDPARMKQLGFTYVSIGRGREA